MNRIILALVCMVLIAAGLPGASAQETTRWVYQEDADYNAVGSYIGVFGFNKPDAADGVLWTYKIRNSTDYYYGNLTLPVECWDASPDNITMRFYGYWGSQDINRFRCLNTTDDWQQFDSLFGQNYPFASGTGDDPTTMYDGDWDTGACYNSWSGGNWETICQPPFVQFYEGAVWWNITQNESGMAMAASPAWTTTQNSILVTCTYNTSLPINATLRRDGAAVSNPYYATLSDGSYNFTCFLNDSASYYPSYEENTLTIGTEGFDCTNASTYSFYRYLDGLQGHNVTLNLTDMVGFGLVKSDLSDVYTSRKAWTSTSGGYYFKVNVTGINNVTVYFGNYLGANSYNTASGLQNVTNVTEYSQANSYYILTTLDEMNSTEQLPSGSNVTMTLYCDRGQSVFGISDSTILIPTFDSQLDGFRSTVNYPGDYYTRDYLVDNPVESRNIYDADAYSFSVLQIPIYINDYVYYNSEITIYKRVNGEPVVITEGYFDNEHKFTAYLIRDEPYYIRLTVGSTIREAGFFKPVTAESLTLNINTVSIDPGLDYISDYIGASASNTSLTNIQVSYNDSSGGTQSVRVRAYEDTNQTAFFDSIYDGLQSFSIAVSPVNMTAHYYSVKFDITHSTYGNSPVTVTRRVAGVSPIMFGIAPTWLYGVIGFIIMLFLSLSITPKDRLVGIVMMIVGLGILGTFTWTLLNPGILTLVVIFAAVSVIYEIRRGGFA